MQTLGLSPSTPKTESRLKTLFWPTIESLSDVEVVGHQVFWVCTIVAVFSLVFGIFQGWFVLGFLESLFFFLGGVGAHERSRFAAVAVFSAYLLSTVALLRVFVLSPGPGILRVILLALLFANVRATWLSAKSPASASRPLSDPVNETLADKFADRLPAYLWPKLRWLFYALTGLEASLMLFAIAARILR